MSTNEIVIVGAKRTAIGSFQGQFNGVASPKLGAAAIQSALEQAKLSAEHVEEVLMGCVLPAGIGQAPARQAALGAGVPMGTPCTTVNKVCGSGMKTVMQAHDAIKAGSIKAAIAGGMESMTEAPYLLPNARGGMRMGHQQTLDHMFYDGLQNPYDGNMMGSFGETCADKYAFTREAQDAFATTSVERAQKAVAEGTFKAEIAPVTVKTRKGEHVVDQDEEPPRCKLEKIPTLRPAFKKDGTVTAANASKISDGAAALVLMHADAAKAQGCTPLARIVGHASHAHEPEWFTTAPVSAMQKLLDKVGWKADDVDLWEINEAFAVVTMAAIHDLHLDPEKVNIHGGACALGHPIGASGARLIVTLIHALQQRGLKRGIASLCIGGGEATAIAIELV